MLSFANALPGVPSLKVSYEDCRARPAEEFARVLRFLGVENPQAELHSPLKKMLRASHRDIIANYDEVEALLKNSKYRHLIQPAAVTA